MFQRLRNPATPVRSEPQTVMAMAPADFVANGRTDQITAFTGVAATMQKRQIEEAATILHKSRAAADQ